MPEINRWVVRRKVSESLQKQLEFGNSIQAHFASSNELKSTNDYRSFIVVASGATALGAPLITGLLNQACPTSSCNRSSSFARCRILGNVGRTD